MKKGTFYILTCGYIAEAKAGYIYETARNRYGIDNRGDKLRPVWHISDLVTGCGIGGSFNTRKAAADSITDHIENIILKNQGGTPHADRARETIAAAYQNGTPAAEQPPALKYTIEIYESNGTPRAAFKRPAADYTELDIPAAEIDIYKKEIIKNNAPGRVDFIETCPASLAEIVKAARESAAERPERRAAKNPAPAPAEAPTEAQRAREEAILYDYIIESRDPAKIKRLLDKTSNRAERFWDDVRSIAGYLSDHAQSRYQVLAEALYKIRFTTQESPTAPAETAADETPAAGTESPAEAPTTPAADKGRETPTTAARQPETATAPRLRYVFRIFTDWTIYAGLLSEQIIAAGSDEEAQQKAIELAAGRAFTCNRMEEGQTAAALAAARPDEGPEKITAASQGTTPAAITANAHPAARAPGPQQAGQGQESPTAATAGPGKRDSRTGPGCSTTPPHHHRTRTGPARPQDEQRPLFKITFIHDRTTAKNKSYNFNLIFG